MPSLLVLMQTRVNYQGSSHLLEEKFDIKFTLFELMIENFRNINLITDMVLKVR